MKNIFKKNLGLFVFVLAVVFTHYDMAIRAQNLTILVLGEIL
jgi:hypothetical protein